MRTLFTARTLAASAAAAALVVGGALPSATAANSDRDRDRDHRNRAWVEVCQRVHDADRYEDYRASYNVRDEDSYRTVYLRGSYDCRRVRVHSGWVRVSIDEYPDNARVERYRSFKFYLHRGDYKRVTFHYEADDDDHDYGRAA